MTSLFEQCKWRCKNLATEKHSPLVLVPYLSVKNSRFLKYLQFFNYCFGQFWRSHRFFSFFKWFPSNFVGFIKCCCVFLQIDRNKKIPGYIPFNQIIKTWVTLTKIFWTLLTLSHLLHERFLTVIPFLRLYKTLLLILHHGCTEQFVAVKIK